MTFENFLELLKDDLIDEARSVLDEWQEDEDISKTLYGFCENALMEHIKTMKEERADHYETTKNPSEYEPEK